MVRGDEDGSLNNWSSGLVIFGDAHREHFKLSGFGEGHHDDTAIC
jgi:hypothetical protein